LNFSGSERLLVACDKNVAPSFLQYLLRDAAKKGLEHDASAVCADSHQVNMVVPREMNQGRTGLAFYNAGDHFAGSEDIMRECGKLEACFLGFG